MSDNPQPETGLARQTSALPTNKLVAAVPVQALITAAWTEVMPAYAPDLAGPGMAALVGAVAAFVIGYLVPDRVNTPAA